MQHCNIFPGDLVPNKGKLKAVPTLFVDLFVVVIGFYMTLLDFCIVII